MAEVPSVWPWWPISGRTSNLKPPLAFVAEFDSSQTGVARTDCGLSSTLPIKPARAGNSSAGA
jgi:hypothetical protein